MRKIWQIAAREFVATVFTKGFIIGLLIVPLIARDGVLSRPRLFARSQSAVSKARSRSSMRPARCCRMYAPCISARRSPMAVTELVERARRRRRQRHGARTRSAWRPKLTVVERPAGADVEQEKAWLNESTTAGPHLALIVLHANAVEPTRGTSNLGSYDLYVPPNRTNASRSPSEASCAKRSSARASTRAGLDRAELSCQSVPRVRSTTVGADGDRNTVFGLNIVIPAAFMVPAVHGRDGQRARAC